MKGITHFLTGVATATFFPTAVAATVHDKSWIILIGGAMGIMADTLDFRVSRYMMKHDHEVTVTEDNLDPKMIARTVAKAINEAYEQKRTVRLKLHTLKVSANYYRTYSIQFDNIKREVTATIGPLKGMGQVMGGGGAGKPNSTPGGIISHTEKYQPELADLYQTKTEVAIFSGPDFAFVPESDGRVRADFIPWHRTWAHSLALGLLLGLISVLFYLDWGHISRGTGSFFTDLAFPAFWIGLLGFMSHVANDQLGILGSQIFYPWGHKRMKGLGMGSSADAVNNILCNYLSISLIIFNINAFSGQPLFLMPWAAKMTPNFLNMAYYFVSLGNFLVYYILIPAVIFRGLVRLYHYLSATRSDENREEMDEVEEEAAGDMGMM